MRAASIMLAFVVLTACSGDRAPIPLPYPYPASPDTAARMKILEEVGLAEKLVPGAEVQEVWVNPRVWAGIPFDQKRKVAGYVSDYFNEKRTGGAIVIVKDNLTGRRLARLGPDGFTLD